MIKISKGILFFLFIVFILNVDAQNLVPDQKQDSLILDIVILNGKTQIKNLDLFPKKAEIESLKLEISLTNFKLNKNFVQNPVRIEVERQINGKTERIEIARFFLPWMEDETKLDSLFVFDISPYSLLFKQAVDVQIETNYIIQPLEMNLHFNWKIGVPPAQASKIINLWSSDITGYAYGNKANPINQQIKNKTIVISENVKYALLKIYLSGNGMDNLMPNEAECSKFYFLNINEHTIAKRPIWRDDCSLNALFPQEGAWTYSRANWCPGQTLREFNHFMLLGSDTTLNIDLQIQETKKENPLPKNYVLSANLILFEKAEFKNDAALVEILAPNKSLLHKRYNPICSSPVIRVRNTGSDTLRSVLIQYGLDNKTDNRYRWKGELAFMEEEIVYLPPLNWYFFDQKNKPKEFTVSVSAVNNLADEYPENNQLSTILNLAPIYPNKISIQFSAPQAASDNIIELVDDMGIPLFEASEFINDSIYNFDLDLDPGCYEFIVYDQKGDGIHPSVNKAKKGSLKIFNTENQLELKDFELNFGSEIRQQFMILK